MMNCPTCKTIMQISLLQCKECNLNVQGCFHAPRLSRLSQENRKLAEMFLLTGGSLKHLAEKMQLSYPTLRRKVDEMISELSKLRADDTRESEMILDKIEKGLMSAQEGLRLIREMNGEN